MRRRISIPVDILRIIVGHLGKADLVTICLLNKVCCSCAQDVLYRNMKVVGPNACRTLSTSPHLARRVRLFLFSLDDPLSTDSAIPVYYANATLATALRNMTSHRKLALFIGGDSDILDGCASKLEVLSADFACDKSFRKFLNSHPGLKSVSILTECNDFSDLEATCLPNLTEVTAWFLRSHTLFRGAR